MIRLLPPLTLALSPQAGRGGLSTLLPRTHSGPEGALLPSR